MAIYTKLRDLLVDANLSEAEAATYIELLKKPAETIWDLVQRTGFAKSVVYRAFSKLESLKMVEKNENGIRALSLKTLVSELTRSERRLRKTAFQIKNIAPFLRAPSESIEELETFYTQDQIADAYLGISLLDFNVSLDFGDFENFVPIIGGIVTTLKFRMNRLKKATNYALCTSDGPYTASFCTDEARVKFKNTVDVADIGFRNNFIVFTDRNDYVLFNNFDDPENPTSVLVKSKAVADIQRLQLKTFSQKLGND